jgi:hypothetical protein
MTADISINDGENYKLLSKFPVEKVGDIVRWEGELVCRVAVKYVPGPLHVTVEQVAAAIKTRNEERAALKTEASAVNRTDADRALNMLRIDLADDAIDTLLSISRKLKNAQADVLSGEKRMNNFPARPITGGPTTISGRGPSPMDV